jgi:uncharacterized membrane protein
MSAPRIPEMPPAPEMPGASGTSVELGGQLGEQQRREARLNVTISRVLAVGLAAAMFLLVVGVILTLVRQGTVIPRKTSIHGIPGALRAFEPGGFFELGLLVLLATPAARVVALCVAYLRRRQWLFSGISLFVLAILILSGYLGLAA